MVFSFDVTAIWRSVHWLVHDIDRKWGLYSNMMISTQPSISGLLHLVQQLQKSGKMSTPPCSIFPSVVPRFSKADGGLEHLGSSSRWDLETEPLVEDKGETRKPGRMAVKHHNNA